jgi:hypothetical protein
LTINTGWITGFGDVTIPAGAALNVTGTGLTTIQGGLNVNGTASLAPGGDKTLHVRSELNITGLFDLHDNDLVIGSGGTIGTGNLFKYATYINSSRNGGDWLGTTGLTSTSARNANPRNTMLGVVTAPEYWTANGTISFNGVHVEQLMILVKYTYYGDTDFNGVVNFDDYARTDAGFNSGNGFWSNGNFDLAGVVTFDDYSLIDLAFNTQGSVL